MGKSSFFQNKSYIQKIVLGKFSFFKDLFLDFFNQIYFIGRLPKNTLRRLFWGNLLSSKINPWRKKTPRIMSWRQVLSHLHQSTSGDHYNVFGPPSARLPYTLPIRRFSRTLIPQWLCVLYGLPIATWTCFWRTIRSTLCFPGEGLHNLHRSRSRGDSINVVGTKTRSK